MIGGRASPLHSWSIASRTSRSAVPSREAACSSSGTPTTICPAASRRPASSASTCSRALVIRTPRLLQQLAVARADGTYANALARLAKVAVLVLDDFLLAPMTDVERRDLLEVLEDRYDTSSTVITSQIPVKSWHQAIGEASIADAICDRVVHNAHLVTLRGGSMRKKAVAPEVTETKT
ncbi:ATP-binding protein [Sorangium sp. So ce341]|uniref:ATP-binding protein n=1 Tax=Sorangium sp. So ce341 TaxID=3133302 RepID=UPI003F62466A